LAQVYCLEIANGLVEMRFLLLAVAAFAIELTPDTWDAETSGKTVFVKFYAPWCGHCKTMKPHWDALMAEYDGHASVLVADVDCIGDGKDLCSQHGVEGFPTLKYGDPNDLEAYEGGREESDLFEFAKENLKPSCSVANIDLCDEDKKAQIAKFQAIPAAELEKLVEEKEAELKKASSDFDEAVQGLQSEYEAMQKTKDDTIAAVKDSGLGLIKSVVSHLENRGCDVVTFEACSEKEQKYVEKMRAKGGIVAELARLVGMKGSKMKPEQKEWLGQRIKTLEKMEENGEK